VNETFQRWCVLNNAPPLPAVPHHVARFVADIAPFGIEAVWSAVQEIARAHYTVGLADPTQGYPVAAAVSEVAGLEPPRSWPDEQKRRFKTLPLDLQRFIAAQEARQDAVVKIAQQEASDARKAAGLPKLPKNFYRKSVKGIEREKQSCDASA